MKVNITKTVLHGVYLLEDYGTEVDAPAADVQRWQKAIREFRDIQKEMAPYYPDPGIRSNTGIW